MNWTKITPETELDKEATYLVRRLERDLKYYIYYLIEFDPMHKVWYGSTGLINFCFSLDYLKEYPEEYQVEYIKLDYGPRNTDTSE